MKGKFSALVIAVAAFGAPAANAEGTDVDFQALEARVAEMESAHAATMGASARDKVRINGFLSAGFGTANVEDGFSYDNGLYDQMSHKSESVVGLQFDASVNEKTNAVVQLVARGPEEFATQAEWVYVGYRPTEADEFRAGRLRAGFYLMSEYLEVGYAYPWTRPPAEVYQSGFPSSFDGLSWSHRINAGSWQHDLQANWGSTKSPAGASNQVDAEDAFGLLWAGTVSDWQFNARLSGAKVTSRNKLFDALSSYGLIDEVDREPMIYKTLGVTYDNGRLLAMIEGTQVDADGILADTESGYVSVGYRFGKVMPHLTYAGIRVTDDNERSDLPALASLCPMTDPNPNASLCMAIVPNTTPLPVATLGIPFPADTLARMLEAEQESVTLGVRYDFLPNAALKFDWSRVLDTHGTFGLLKADSGNIFYDASGAPMVPEDTKFNVFRVVVDVVF